MEHQLSFPSKAENLNQVEVLINDLCEKFEVNEDYYGNILIALTEAVNNAIHHGNKSNPNKEVKIISNTDGSVLKFTIKDDGPGFDFDNLPDPTDPQNIEKPHGRGVFLMRNLADEIEFNDEGATVVMSFNLENELLQEVQKEKEEKA
ncbi:MAG: ATP-binding protein [Flavobacteriales bacterium]|jgi:serine/threonine-protein kinase RsbW